MTEFTPAGRPRRFATLHEAKAADDGVVLLEADWGGQTLVVARATAVHCNEETLQALLFDLDALAWPVNNMQGTWLTFKAARVGERVGGGMGGGLVTDDVWCHAELVQAGVESGVRRVFAGECRRLPEPDPAVEPQQRAAILAAYANRSPAYGLEFGWGWPESFSSLHFDDIRSRMNAEIPPRPDGERWWGATLRAVVRQAGLAVWVEGYTGADDRWDDSWGGSLVGPEDQAGRDHQDRS